MRGRREVVRSKCGIKRVLFLKIRIFKCVIEYLTIEGEYLIYGILK